MSVTDTRSLAGLSADNRNGDDGLAAYLAGTETMIVSMYGGPEVVAQRKRILQSARDARTCAKCGGTIGEVVYIRSWSVRAMFGWGRMLARLCDGCARPGNDAAGRCEGCGRMVISRCDWRYRRHNVCSTRCGLDVQNAARRVEPSRRPCSTCGQEFAARADAAYCSAACRQKAYRRRKVDTVEATS